jgi:hypothetical protein
VLEKGRREVRHVLAGQTGYSAACARQVIDGNERPAGWVEHSETRHGAAYAVALRWVSRSLSSGARSRDPLAQPILVIAQSVIVGLFREEWPATDLHPVAGRWRSDRTHPEQFMAAP